MGVSSNNQTGFGLVGPILAVAVMIVLGTGSWFVYQHNRTRATSAAAGNNQPPAKQTPKQTTTQPTPSQVAVNIPELGISITVPDDIKDLTYQVSTGTLPGGKQGTIARLSTKALTTLDAQCGTDFGPLGTLEKVDGIYPTQSQDQTSALDYGQLVKQFTTFFISYGSPQAGCSENSGARDAMGKFKGEFQAALTTIQQLNS